MFREPGGINFESMPFVLEIIVEAFFPLKGGDVPFAKSKIFFTPAQSPLVLFSFFQVSTHFRPLHSWLQTTKNSFSALQWSLTKLQHYFLVFIDALKDVFKCFEV